MYKNAVLTNPRWTSYTNSAEYDTSATAITGGTLLLSTAVAKDGTIAEDIASLIVEFYRLETITLAIKTIAGTTDTACSITWEENI